MVHLVAATLVGLWHADGAGAGTGVLAAETALALAGVVLRRPPTPVLCFAVLGAAADVAFQMPWAIVTLALAAAVPISTSGAPRPLGGTC